jgi:hypothetical protein
MGGQQPDSASWLPPARTIENSETVTGAREMTIGTILPVREQTWCGACNLACLTGPAYGQSAGPPFRSGLGRMRRRDQAGPAKEYPKAPESPNPVLVGASVAV